MSLHGKIKIMHFDICRPTPAIPWSCFAMVSPSPLSFVSASISVLHTSLPLIPLPKTFQPVFSSTLSSSTLTTFTHTCPLNLCWSFSCILNFHVCLNYVILCLLFIQILYVVCLVIMACRLKVMVRRDVFCFI